MKKGFTYTVCTLRNLTKFPDSSTLRIQFVVILYLSNYSKSIARTYLNDVAHFQI